jgi:hypothetical protein
MEGNGQSVNEVLLRCLPGGTENNHQNSSTDSWNPGQDANRVPLEYKSRKLPLRHLSRYLHVSCDSYNKYQEFPFTELNYWSLCRRQLFFLCLMTWVLKCYLDERQVSNGVRSLGHFIGEWLQRKFVARRVTSR